jgi:hypothetical protein
MPDELSGKKRAGKTGLPPVTSIEDKPAAALRAMRLHIELGEVEAALAVYKNSRSQLSGWEPRESDWIDLIQALVDQHNWGEAAHVMRDYVQAVPEPSPRVQLKLAQVLIQKLGRPAQGLSVLKAVPPAALPEKLKRIHNQLAEQAQHMLEEGDLELRDELW